jgi:hypothetical protein
MKNHDQTIKRFIARVHEQPGGCWPWTTATGDPLPPKTYGFLRVGGKIYPAHRLSYILFNGPIPDDLVVMHTCANPACVNPAHLELGTVADNNAEWMNRLNNPQGLSRVRTLAWMRERGLITHWP